MFTSQRVNEAFLSLQVLPNCYLVLFILLYYILQSISKNINARLRAIIVKQACQNNCFKTFPMLLCHVCGSDFCFLPRVDFDLHSLLSVSLTSSYLYFFKCIGRIPLSNQNKSYVFFCFVFVLFCSLNTVYIECLAAKLWNVSSRGVFGRGNHTKHRCYIR